MALTTNLIAHWTLDEASGTREDSHGANDLTDNNTVTQDVGKIGSAAQFAVANQEYLSIADNTDLSVADIDFTIACWAYLDSKSQFMILVSKWTDPSPREYMLYYNVGSDRVVFGVSPDGTAAVEVVANNLGAPSIATWYFIVAWHDSVANTINIQVNNGTVDSLSHTTGVVNGVEPFILGAYSNGGAFHHNGRLDSVSFWKRVLTADERTSLYNGDNGLNYPFAGSAGSTGAIYPFFFGKG